MASMTLSTNVCATNSIINEQMNNCIYKAGYEELSSYCLGLISSIAEIAHAIEYGRIDQASACIRSLGIGLGFVLEDIRDIERRLDT